MSMTKIDRRKNYYLVVDTETANGLDCPIVYDIGGVIVDKKGKIYETFSFVIYDVFKEMSDLMQTAYYADKIPMYLEQLKKGERKFVRYSTARKIVKELCDRYDVTAIVAHNMRFDYLATANTERYLTKSKHRYFFPYGIPLFDTLRMARDTICKQKLYQKFCVENGYVTKNGKPKATAEILYRYITGNNDFIEEHTGLADVLIEKEILAKCFRQHKPMNKYAFGRQGTTQYPIFFVGQTLHV